MCLCWYEGNSKSKVLYFILTEKVSALNWQACVQLSSVPDSSSSQHLNNVDRLSSGFEMATVLEEWQTKKCFVSFVFLWANVLHLLKFIVNWWQCMVVM
jgi:hypothetical protein